eukprot:g7201.t1
MLLSTRRVAAPRLESISPSKQVHRSRGWCEKCETTHDWVTDFKTDESTGSSCFDSCIPPLNVVHFRAYRIALYAYEGAGGGYTTKEILDSALGKNPDFPSFAQWKSNTEVDLDSGLRTTDSGYEKTLKRERTFQSVLGDSGRERIERQFENERGYRVSDKKVKKTLLSRAARKVFRAARQVQRTFLYNEYDAVAFPVSFLFSDVGKLPPLAGGVLEKVAAAQAQGGAIQSTTSNPPSPSKAKSSADVEDEGSTSSGSTTQDNQALWRRFVDQKKQSYKPKDPTRPVPVMLDPKTRNEIEQVATDEFLRLLKKRFAGEEAPEEEGGSKRGGGSSSESEPVSTTDAESSAAPVASASPGDDGAEGRDENTYKIHVIKGGRDGAGLRKRLETDDRCYKMRDLVPGEGFVYVQWADDEDED